MTDATDDRLRLLVERVERLEEEKKGVSDDIRDAYAEVILSMIKRWRWALCLPLVVARRSDGTLWVLDGQHRQLGARERGDIPFLPCVVLRDFDPAEEADTFLAINTERQKLSEADKFNAMLAAGHGDARAIADLLIETGWRVRKSSNSAIFEPGDLACAPMLVRAYRKYGADTVELALLVLRAAYPDAPVRPAATLLVAIMDLVSREEIDGVDALAKVIARRTPNDWIARRDVTADSRGLSRNDAAWRVMQEAMSAPPIRAAA